MTTDGVTIKFCKECKHYEHRGDILSPRCTRQEPNKNLDLVTGEEHKYWPCCENERGQGICIAGPCVRCGKDAQFFEAKKGGRDES